MEHLQSVWAADRKVPIDGMLAVHAKHAVFMALAAVEGITRAEVELGRAELTLAEGVSQAAIRAAIADAGFAVTAIRILPRTLPTI